MYDDTDRESVNHDAVNFENFENGNVSDEWRAAADRMSTADEDCRIRRGGDFQLGLAGDEQIWYNQHMKRLLIAARHMFTMLGNGIDFGGATLRARTASVNRRIRFSYHGVNFRFALHQLRQRLGEDFELPGGNESYRLLVPYSRVIRFQEGAVPNDVDTRATEWIRLHRIMEDQVNVRYPLSYFPTALRSSPSDIRQAMWTQSLLEPILTMIPVLERHIVALVRPFTILDGAILRAQLQTLHARPQALDAEPGSSTAFRDLDPEQNAVLDTADLFANRLLRDAEEQEYPVDWMNQPDPGRAEHLFAGRWCYEILSTIWYDTRNMNRLDTPNLPPRIPQLHRLLTALQAAVEDFARQPDAPTGISHHHLLNLRHILAPHLDPDEEDPEHAAILAPDGPLRPISFRAFQLINDIDNAMRDVQPSPRSSVSSNADNTIREDRALIKEEHLAAVEAAMAGSSDPTSTLILDILRHFRRILKRMDEPGLYGTHRNQEDFDWLNDQYRRHHAVLLVVDHPDLDNNEDFRRIARALARRMPYAARNIEINSAGPGRRRNLRQLRTRLVEGRSC